MNSVESEIAAGDVPGGTSTSHTIMVDSLATLLDNTSFYATEQELHALVLEDNILGKSATGARERSLRYLRELYLLRPEALLFRALRDLWSGDREAQPLLAGLCALARDPVFRATTSAIINTSPGDEVNSENLELAVEAVFPDNYNQGTRAKIGRNTASSWEQTGHLEATSRHVKVRRRAVCRPVNVAYALLLGHLEGARGEGLFETVWAQVLDRPRSHLFDMAAVASHSGYIDLRHGGGVTEVGFRELLRPIEGKLL